jgi:hypothetical protein
MVRPTVLLLAALVTAVAGALSADTVYVPAAANAAGANQTSWRTDLQVKATDDGGATFTVELLETGAVNTDPAVVELTLAPGESLRLGNLLDAAFGFTGTAALRVEATDGAILVSSRTYNDDPAGTYGQTVPGVPEEAATRTGARATLIQLSRSPDPSTGFRTNVGFVNVTDGTITVDVELFAADGSSLGTVSRNLRAFEHKQVNDVFHAAGADDVADGYAVARTASAGGRFICYASVVDNGSGDAVFIPGATEVDPLPPQPRLAILESFLRPGCPVCLGAEAALRDLKAEFADDNVLIIEQNVDDPLGSRLERWLEANTSTGTIYLPLVMTDSGHDISSGEENYEHVYSEMITDSLQRPATASMAVETTRSGSILRFDVRLTNRSGTKLSAANDATLTALLWQEPFDPEAVPFVTKARSTTIPTLADGATGELVLEVSLTGLDTSRVGWVLIADYQPTGSANPYDTLQAVAGP